MGSFAMHVISSYALCFLTCFACIHSIPWFSSITIDSSYFGVTRPFFKGAAGKQPMLGAPGAHWLLLIDLGLPHFRVRACTWFDGRCYIFCLSISISTQYVGYLVEGVFERLMDVGLVWFDFRIFIYGLWTMLVFIPHVFFRTFYFKKMVWFYVSHSPLDFRCTCDW